MDDQQLTCHSSVSAVIAAYAASAAAGRELRAALSHVDAELGTMPVRNVRARHVSALLDDLESAGISEHRESAVIDALRALFAFAYDRGLVTTAPVTHALDGGPPPGPHDGPTHWRQDGPPHWPHDGPIRGAHDDLAPPAMAGPARVAGPATPTATMLALGVRVATWTAVSIMVVFLLLLAALIAELA